MFHFKKRLAFIKQYTIEEAIAFSLGMLLACAFLYVIYGFFSYGAIYHEETDQDIYGRINAFCNDRVEQLPFQSMMQQEKRPSQAKENICKNYKEFQTTTGDKTILNNYLMAIFKLNTERGK